MRDDIVPLIGAGLVAALLFAAVVFVSVARYRECRAHGFSAFYCMGSR